MTYPNLYPLPTIDFPPIPDDDSVYIKPVVLQASDFKYKHHKQLSHDDIVKLIQSYYNTHEHIRKIDSRSSIYIDGYDKYIDTSDYSSDEDNEFGPSIHRLYLDDFKLYANHQYFYIKYNRQTNVLKRLIYEYLSSDDFNTETSLTIVFIVKQNPWAYNQEVLYETAFWLTELFKTIANPDISNDVKRVEFAKILGYTPYGYEPTIDRCSHVHIKCCDFNGEFFDAIHKM